MSKLAEMVAKGLVRAKAQVYVNSNDGKGLAIFQNDMRERGVVEVAEEHYELNQAQTDALRAYTGAIWFEHLTEEVRAEIRPMLEERGSKEYVEKSGEIRIYNNPLFRAVVALGIWNAPVSDDAAPAIAEQRVQAINTRNFDSISFDIEYAQLEIAEFERLAQVNRKAGFRELAREKASKASQLKQKVQRLQQKQEQLLAAV